MSFTTSCFAGASSPERNRIRLPPLLWGSLARTAAAKVLNALTTRAR